MKTQLQIIAETYENMYGSSLITEELHPEIKSILDNTNNPKMKLGLVAKKIRSLTAQGQDTGLQDDKPKKGSSRAVFFSKEPKKINVDGVDTETHTATKIAFPGVLDKYHNENTLLGEDQNRLESDHHLNNSYGVLRRNPHTGEYHTNNNPVLPPVFDHHPDHHYLEMGKADKFNAKDMAEATKTKEFPKGLTLDEVKQSMTYQHNLAHGQTPYLEKYSENHLESVANHPWVENAISMMHDSGMNPGDISPRNMGIYKHPVTGVKHPVIIDYGFSNKIAKKYRKARNAYYKKG